MNREIQQEGPSIFTVVFNHEEQYSIWPSDCPLPAGWKAAGKIGNKQECLDYIKDTWTDMRPLSLRTKMDRGEEPTQGAL